MTRIIAGCPTYDGTRHNATALIQLNAAGVRVVEMQLSNLTRAFNELLCYALNEKATHFLMLHADVVPTTLDWPRIMYREMANHGADVLSAVSPIKTASTVTSTAIDTEDVWRPLRLTFAEIAQRPITWTERGLLINTGLMLVDLRRSWFAPPNCLCFTMEDRIRFDPSRGYYAEARTEDWEFSRAVRQRGGTVFATKAVGIKHVGFNAWEVAW